jgi:hypothetical protein
VQLAFFNLTEAANYKLFNLSNILGNKLLPQFSSTIIGFPWSVSCLLEHKTHETEICGVLPAGPTLAMSSIMPQVFTYSPRIRRSYF